MKHETCFFAAARRERLRESPRREGRKRERTEPKEAGREETMGVGREEAKVWERESLRRENCHSYVYAAVFLCYHCFAEFPPSEEL